MRLTKQTNYAIRILADCARGDGQYMKVADVAGRNGLTLQHALKIAHLLMRKGFLQNQRGRQGGIRLARPAQDIRIGEVVRALELDDRQAANERIDSLLDTAFDAFISVLDQQSLAEFVPAAAVETGLTTRETRRTARSGVTA